MAAAERRGPAPARMTAEEFCAAYYDRVVGLAVRAFGRAEAHDVAHDALSRMLVAYDSLDPDRDPWPWVATIVRNAGRQSLRQSSRQGRPLPLDEAPPVAEPDAAFDVVAAREERRTLARALDRVPRADRDVLLMRVRDELPFAEIARRTGRTPGALRVQAVRARQRLADEFARLGGTAYGIGVLLASRAPRLRDRVAGFAAAVPSAAQLAVAAVVCGGVTGGGGAVPAEPGPPPVVAVAPPARAGAAPVMARAAAPAAPVPRTAPARVAARRAAVSRPVTRPAERREVRVPAPAGRDVVVAREDAPAVRPRLVCTLGLPGC